MTNNKKADSAYFVKATSDAPGGTCASKSCPIKRAIQTGMTCVTLGNKKYHASCAMREEIEFDIPSVPKQKKVD